MTLSAIYKIQPAQPSSTPILNDEFVVSDDQLHMQMNGAVQTEETERELVSRNAEEEGTCLVGFTSSDNELTVNRASTVLNSTASPESPQRISIPINIPPSTTPHEQTRIERTRASLDNFRDPPRTYNTGKDILGMLSHLAQVKTTTPFDKIVFLGFLAGTWFVFAGTFSVNLAGGIPLEVRVLYPVLPKLLVGISFPISIVFILLFGGELFSGSTFIMAIGVLNKKVAINWTLVFLSNLFTILLMTYLFGYIPAFFSQEPYRSYVLNIALRKVAYHWYVSILLGIPANALICLSVFFGLAARDITGKVVGMFLPVFAFAASGWEHSVANMFFVSLGIFYGAEITIGQFIGNIMLVAIGNIIGGAVLIGGSEYYMSVLGVCGLIDRYHWHHNCEPTPHLPEMNEAGNNKLYRSRTLG